MALCVRCTRRPRPKDNSRPHCVPCSRIVQQEQAEEANRKEDASCRLSKFEWVAHWKGFLVGINTETKQTGKFLGPGEPGKVPEEKLIDLDKWVPFLAATNVNAIKRVFTANIGSQKKRKRIQVHDTEECGCKYLGDEKYSCGYVTPRVPWAWA